MCPSVKLHVHEYRYDETDDIGCGFRVDDEGYKTWRCDHTCSDKFDVWGTNFIWQPRLWMNMERVRSVANFERIFLFDEEFTDETDPMNRYDPLRFSHSLL